MGDIRHVCLKTKFWGSSFSYEFKGETVFFYEVGLMGLGDANKFGERKNYFYCVIFKTQPLPDSSLTFLWGIFFSILYAPARHILRSTKMPISTHHHYLVVRLKKYIKFK